MRSPIGAHERDLASERAPDDRARAFGRAPHRVAASGMGVRHRVRHPALGQGAPHRVSLRLPAKRAGSEECKDESFVSTSHVTLLWFDQSTGRPGITERSPRTVLVQFLDAAVRWLRTRNHATGTAVVRCAASRMATPKPSGSGWGSRRSDRQGRKVQALSHLHVVKDRGCGTHRRRQKPASSVTLAGTTGRRLALRHGPAVRHGLMARAFGRAIVAHGRGHRARLGHCHARHRRERQRQRNEKGQDCAKAAHSADSTFLAWMSFQADAGSSGRFQRFYRVKVK
jgi:hypothetical protein